MPCSRAVSVLVFIAYIMLYLEYIRDLSGSTDTHTVDVSANIRMHNSNPAKSNNITQLIHSHILVEKAEWSQKSSNRVDWTL